MKNSEIDKYIANANEDLQSILIHLRELIHKSCPAIEEKIKWNAPSFELNGKIVFSIMAFKKHINFIFTNGKNLNDPTNFLVDIGEKSNMKGIKNIKALEDFADEKRIVELVKAAYSLAKS